MIASVKQNKQIKHALLIISALMVGFILSLSTQALAGGGPQMDVGSITSQPIGHYEYCKSHKNDCRIRSSNTSPIKLTRARWAEMVEANAFANAKIVPVTDQDYYGVEELWALPKSHGDCEDFVLMKRKQLMALGWPASSLLATVVRQKNGEGHAVLTVRTDRADYILDNLNGKIKQWNKTDYTYLKRITPRHSGRWEDIIDSRQIVGSLQ